MIDAVFLLWSSALLEYADAATRWSLTRLRSNAITGLADRTGKTTPVKRGPRTIGRKIIYLVAALVVAMIVGVFVIGAYTILTSLFHF